MSKIYNNKRINNSNNNIQINNNINYYPYDPNKHKAYYESLNNKMKKSLDSNCNNKSNNSKNSIQVKSEIFKNNNDNNINNQINNEGYNNYNIKEQNNNIVQNFLLSSTDTTGPYRYMRKNRKDEPNLIDLLMDK